MFKAVIGGTNIAVLAIWSTSPAFQLVHHQLKLKSWVQQCSIKNWSHQGSVRWYQQGSINFWTHHYSVMWFQQGSVNIWSHQLSINWCHQCSVCFWFHQRSIIWFQQRSIEKIWDPGQRSKTPKNQGFLPGQQRSINFCWLRRVLISPQKNYPKIILDCWNQSIISTII